MNGPTANRIYNFSAGPAVLPVPVLAQAQDELLELPGCGASVMEISHRSKPFGEILQDAKTRLQALLNIPDDYHILFLQGGARLQFSMIPINFLRGSGKPADYILTGSWSDKARDEAVKEGDVHIAWDGAATNYDRLPTMDQLQLTPDAAYVYYTSNETIQGVQFPDEPQVGDVPLVCDASSDFLSRPIAMEKYGLIYACAQKNAGPAGVTIVIVRDDLLAHSQDSLPGYLNYATHAKHDSTYNTPATFCVYIVGLVARWLQNEIGGLAAMQKQNQQKAKMLYDVIDASAGFYSGHARTDCRSMMNVTFRLPSEELEQAFLSEAAKQGLANLKGHRSVGGIRASIYNAMPVEGIQLLSEVMRDFAAKQA